MKPKGAYNSSQLHVKSFEQGVQAFNRKGSTVKANKVLQKASTYNRF